MNRDFVEMLAALSDAGADFLVVGAHALAAHGIPRATGDLDLWIRPTPENARRVWSALERFGAPLDPLKLDDLSSPDIVFQIGVSPNRIDLLTSLTAVSFDEAWHKRIHVRVGDRDVPTIGKQDFLRNKRAVGRPRDLADVADLEALPEE
ncbi:MAG: hypothetical protein ACLFRX_00480 [Gemmatimonadota bacterium]